MREAFKLPVDYVPFINGPMEGCLLEADVIEDFASFLAAIIPSPCTHVL